jgi:hypothetical protein
MPPPHNLYKITLPPHTNQTMEVTFLPPFDGPVVSLLYLSLQFSTLTRNIPQTLQISVAPDEYRPSLSLEEADDAVSETQTDDHVGLGPYWPGPGPIRSRPAAHWHLDDIVVIDSDAVLETQTDDHVGLGPYWPGPGPSRSRSRPAAHWHDPDDIVVIDSESESEADSEETIQVVSLSPLFT